MCFFYYQDSNASLDASNTGADDALSDCNLRRKYPGRICNKSQNNKNAYSLRFPRFAEHHRRSLGRRNQFLYTRKPNLREGTVWFIWLWNILWFSNTCKNPYSGLQMPKQTMHCYVLSIWTIVCAGNGKVCIQSATG